MDERIRNWKPDSLHDVAQLLTTQDAAEIAGLHERAIRRAITRGELDSISERDQLRIRRSDLDSWLADRPVMLAGPFTVAQQRQTIRPGTDYPRPITRLIGREREVAEVSGLLLRPDVRLVTLTGPGGIGKTRLALQVLSELDSAFADGVFFVPLASVPDTERTADAIANVLGVQMIGERPARDSLINALRELETLIVLDNFEHLLESAALITDLLTHSPNLTILVTSQTLLRLSGEQVVPVPPLGVDDSSDDPVSGDHYRSAAVRLFADRATAISPAFRLTDSNATIVEDICHRLDGLPLAIELAAARVNHIPLSTLQERLNPLFPGLPSGPRDAPLRHRTMHDAIAWSYGLLDDAEKSVFQRLAVFAGGFTLEAGELVGGASPETEGALQTLSVIQAIDVERGELAALPLLAPAYPILDIVGSLVDKSLIRKVDDIDQPSRFVMLETIRSFALTQLSASGDEQAIRDVHAAWSLSFVEEFRGGTDYILEDLAWLRPVESEHDNVRAALTWLDRRQAAVAMQRLAVAMQPLWEVRGLHAEAIGWFERAAALQDNNDPALRLRLLASLGRHLKRVGRYDQARVRLQEALDLARELATPDAVARALYALGAAETNLERYTRATQLLEESLDLFRQSENQLGICSAHYFLGIVAYGQGNPADARSHLESALQVRRAAGPIFNLSVILNALSLAQSELHDIPAATDSLAESRSVWERGKGANREVLAEWLAASAWKECNRQNPYEAARLFGCAEALTESIGVPLVVPPRGRYLQLLVRLRQELGETTFAAAWEAGRKTAPEAAVTETYQETTPPSPAAVTLTARERQILGFIVQGETDREIAEKLFLSVRTIEGHVARVLSKLGAPTRTAAVHTAIGAGLLPEFKPNQPKSTS